jgi:peptidoglycan/xylan/chitin deacetylase (PgdA/CDA1 family)
MQVPLSILIYRRIVGEPDPLFPETVDARRFAQHLRLLKRWFHVLPLAQAARALQQRALPSRCACITFDGGHAEHAAVAMPLLQRFGLPATFFVASGFLDGGYSWSDAVVELVRKAPGTRLNLARAGFGTYDIGCHQRRRAVIDLLLAALASLAPLERLERVRLMARRPGATRLSSDQLIAMHRAGMEIGAHTVNQTPLASLSNAEARAEIANGRDRLQDILQAPVRLFSYPSGKPGCDFEQRHSNMLRSAGFDAAVTRAPGAARHDTDLYALPRFTPWDARSSAFLLRLGSNLFTQP